MYVLKTSILELRKGITVTVVRHMKFVGWGVEACCGCWTIMFES